MEVICLCRAVRRYLYLSAGTLGSAFCSAPDSPAPPVTLCRLPGASYYSVSITRRCLFLCAGYSALPISLCRLPGASYFSVPVARHSRHSRLIPDAWATVCMSLSPRPDRFTNNTSSLAICGASFIAYATACDDSRAGIIPSVRVSA